MMRTSYVDGPLYPALAALLGVALLRPRALGPVGLRVERALKPEQQVGVRLRTEGEAVAQLIVPPDGVVHLPW